MESRDGGRAAFCLTAGGTLLSRGDSASAVFGREGAGSAWGVVARGAVSFSAANGHACLVTAGGALQTWGEDKRGRHCYSAPPP